MSDRCTAIRNLIHGADDNHGDIGGAETAVFLQARLGAPATRTHCAAYRSFGSQQPFQRLVDGG